MNFPLNSVSQIPSNPPKVEGIQISEREMHRLWDAAKQLEATFSGYLLKELKFSNIDGGEKQTFAADVYGDMFKRSLAEQLATSGSLGLAKQIYQDSVRLVSKAAGVPSAPPAVVSTENTKKESEGVISPSALRFGNYTA